MAIRFLFGGLLAGALVPPAIAQSSNAASENPQDVFLSLQGTPSMGDPKARVAIVEFGDYQCPYCREHANHTLPQIINVAQIREGTLITSSTLACPARGGDQGFASFLSGKAM